MIKLYKDRTLKFGAVVEVYRNLHNNLFSIRDKESGLVLAHGNKIVLFHCKFIVKDSGRLKVIKEKRKNVHAWVEGVYIGTLKSDLGNVDNIAYYDPYKTESFIDALTGEKLTEKGAVIMSDGKVITHSSDK